MDNNIIILCQKISTVRYRKKFFQNLDKQYMSGVLPDTEIMELFLALKDFYTYYFRAIKFLYRMEGRRIHMPKQLFQEAQKDKKISFGDAWLLYIEYMNEFLYIEYMNEFFNLQDKKQTMEQAKNIIEQFRSYVYKSCDEFCNPKRLELYENTIDKIIKLKKDNITLDNNKPIYQAKEIGISERSYEIIMRTFRANSCIKNVWLHGSRAYNTGTYASDLDLIIDCPKEKYDDIINQLNNLSVPYFFDCKNLYDSACLHHIQITQILGTKKIYCAEDIKGK